MFDNISVTAVVIAILLTPSAVIGSLLVVGYIKAAIEERRFWRWDSDAHAVIDLWIAQDRATKPADTPEKP